MKTKTKVKVAVFIIIAGVATYAFLDNKYGTIEVDNSTAPAPVVEIQTEYTDMYNDLVTEIHKEEEGYWKEKAQLSAERQASDQLAEMFAAKAEEKRLEEQSL